MTVENVVLVDDQDNETGVMEKLEAHRSGRLHRALSVFIFNTEGKWLLHKRAEGKYHSENLWTNACCSHPRPGEAVAAAARRRLLEEMGLTCRIEHSFTLKYRAELEHGLIEHEYDHIFLGYSDVTPLANPLEVSEWKYVSTSELDLLVKEHPEKFTAWFKLIFPAVVEKMNA